jgi:hypothetical protein
MPSNNIALFEIRDGAFDALGTIASKIRRAVLTPTACVSALKANNNVVLDRDLSEDRWAWGKYIEPQKHTKDEDGKFHVGFYGTSHAVSALAICNKFGCREEEDARLIENGKNWLQFQFLNDNSFTRRRKGLNFLFLPKLSHFLEALCAGDYSKREECISKCRELLRHSEFCVGEAKWRPCATGLAEKEPHPVATSLVLHALMNVPDFTLSSSFEDGMRWICEYLHDGQFDEGLNRDLGAFCLLLNTIIESPIPKSNSTKIIASSKDFLLSRIQEDDYWSDSPLAAFTISIDKDSYKDELNYHLNRKEIILKAAAHLDLNLLIENQEIKQKVVQIFNSIRSGNFFRSASGCEIYPALAMCLLCETLIDEIDRRHEILLVVDKLNGLDTKFLNLQKNFETIQTNFTVLQDTMKRYTSLPNWFFLFFEFIRQPTKLLFLFVPLLIIFVVLGLFHVIPLEHTVISIIVELLVIIFAVTEIIRSKSKKNA